MIKIRLRLELPPNNQITAEQINQFLANTPLSGLGSTFKQAESETGVPASMLVAIACHESDYGKSNIARTKNQIFGFRCYDRNPAKHALAVKSKKECVLIVARYLKTNYLSPSGKYFHGYDLAAINTHYASDRKWHLKVARIQAKLEGQRVRKENESLRIEMVNAQSIFPVQYGKDKLVMTENGVLMIGISVGIGLWWLRNKTATGRMITSVPMALIKSVCLCVARSGNGFVGARRRFGWELVKEDFRQARQVVQVKRRIRKIRKLEIGQL